MATTQHDALRALRTALGDAAAFRDGQEEAILELVGGAGRLLLVQRTGWGKSIVYFTATRLLRDAGRPPTIVVSPLLSLMRDQRRSAARFALTTAHVDARADFAAIAEALQAGAIDVVFTTPEQLARERFRSRILDPMGGEPGLIVVDEAHCISDWGHDFRPEYRRLARSLQALAVHPPLLATTATANDRVVADVAEQLGADLVVERGPLARRSLRLQAIDLPSKAARLAWLAENLPGMDGAGIVYCLTVADCTRVAAWLQSQGIDAEAYHAELDETRRTSLEERLLTNDVKALVATVALGMGFDKPDLGFVVHYQLPASIVAYYQQVGRAGRALETAHAVLLSGREDAEIHEHFITTAFPAEEDVAAVLEALEASGGLKLDELLARVNVSRTKAQAILQTLELDELVTWERGTHYRTNRPWHPERERMARVTARRREELAQVHGLLEEQGCLMRVIVSALDDPAPLACGVCASCAGPAFPDAADPATEEAALRFLGRAHVEIAPRKQYPPTPEGGRKNIPAGERCEEGRALSTWRDGARGERVASARRSGEAYGDDLVDALAALVRSWAPEPAPAWVTAVPSEATEEDRSAAVAQGLAARLSLPYAAALARDRSAPPQRTQMNSTAQRANAAAAVSLAPGVHVPPGPVLLVDELIVSGWTTAVAGALLRGAGAAAVYPLTLAKG